MDHRFDRLVSENNQFFYGTVVASDAATYSVQVAPSSPHMPAFLSGIMLSSVMAGMFGIKECVLPQPGSTLFCYKNDAYTCLVLGVVPDQEDTGAPEAFHARASLGAGDSQTCGNNTQGYAGPVGLSKTFISNANRPTDIVEGEYALANEFGIMMGLFQQFAVLKASELAQIQFFIYDDLVRLITHNFEHFTCMGGTKIFQDGPKLTQEINITHDATEASGRPNTNGADMPSVIELTGKVTPDDKDDFFKLTNDKQLPIDRLRGFVGALGDFIHLILSKPVDGQLRALDGVAPTKFDTGLASAKMNMDGSVALRTVAGISFEKTNWIRVPHRIKPVEEKETKEPKKHPKGFQFDTSVRSGNLPFLHFLQLRDYLAYTMEDVAYRQFVDSDKFAVNDKPDKEEKLDATTQITPEHTGTFYPNSSGCYIMPNGGLVFKDAWGSSIVMEGGNVYIQPAKDLVFQPLRNMVAKVGQHVSISAKKDLDLSSTAGGLRIKTDKSQHLYSASSGIVLHSDAERPSEYFPKDTAITDVGGIVLHAPKAGVVTHAAHTLFKSEENMVIKSNLCLIDAASRVLLRSNDGFDVFTTGDLLLSAGKNLIGFTEGTAILVGLENTALGIEKQTIAIGASGAVQGLFEAKAFDDWKAKSNELATSDFQEFSVAYKEDTAFDELKFRFLEASNYQLTARVDAIPQTMAQQEDAKFGTTGLKKWVEKPVNGTLPYPGAGELNTYATSELVNLQFDPKLQDTYNKATEHSFVGRIDFADLFKEYPVYG